MYQRPDPNNGRFGPVGVGRISKAILKKSQNMLIPLSLLRAQRQTWTRTRTQLFVIESHYHLIYHYTIRNSRVFGFDLLFISPLQLQFQFHHSSIVSSSHFTLTLPSTLSLQSGSPFFFFFYLLLFSPFLVIWMKVSYTLYMNAFR